MFVTGAAGGVLEVHPDVREPADAAGRAATEVATG